MNSLVIQRDFDPNVASELDTDSAIILENIVYWIGQNMIRGKNFYQDKYWTYNTAKAFQAFFPYLTEKQIRTRLLKLEELKYLTTGNFNKSKYDKTTWYALGEKYEYRLTHLPNGNIEDTKSMNGEDQTVTPIPNDKPDVKPIKEILENDPIQEYKEGKQRAAQRRGRRLGMTTKPQYTPSYQKFEKKGGTHAEDIV